MSGLEVIGGISGVIAILDATKKVWESAKKDINLPKTFIEVARRLPILQETLQTCENHLKPIANELPKDAIEAVDKSVESIKSRARELRDIFEETIPGSDSNRMDRLKKAVKSLGKGKKVEELMQKISMGTRDIANLHVVKSASPELAKNMDKLIKELGDFEPSLPNEKSQGNSYINYGERQYNNTGTGQMFNYEDMTGKQNFNFGASQSSDSP